jgi:hypothetical protein
VQGNDGRAEFTGEFEAQGFAFEVCRNAMLGRPGFIDFPTALGE